MTIAHTSAYREGVFFTTIRADPAAIDQLHAISCDIWQQFDMKLI